MKKKLKLEDVDARVSSLYDNLNMKFDLIRSDLSSRLTALEKQYSENDPIDPAKVYEGLMSKYREAELVDLVELTERYNLKAKDVKKVVDYFKDKFTPEEKIIKVPDSIKFEVQIGFGDQIGIVFNDSNQSLYFSNSGFYSIGNPRGCDVLSGSYFKLVKVNPEDRKVGCTYFHTDRSDMNNSIDLYHYCKYLGDEKYCFIADGGVKISKTNYDHWYQVVRI